VPFVSGNVSLYNEGARRAPIPPSPIVACVGFLPDYRRAAPMLLAEEGDVILLVGGESAALGASEYLALDGDPSAAPVAAFDPQKEREEIHGVIEAVRSGRVRAAHDLSSGGLLVALAEMCLAREEEPLGLEVACEALGTPWSSLSREALYFGEGPGFLLEVAAGDRGAVAATFTARGVPVAPVARVIRAPRFVIRRRGATPVEISVIRLREAWEGGLKERLL
jgi:phosphoribosylformylglycinamidine (FGAM) synthase-like enzyme